jgi:hypothetical protein
MTRATAAWFARRYASATRREISTALDLSHPDSAGNMARRIEREHVESARLRKDLAASGQRVYFATEMQAFPFTFE